MSGSPVYIDGKLIGAVSYALGQLLQGTDRRHHADRRDDRRDRRSSRTRAPGSRVKVEFPLSRDGLIAVVPQGAQLESSVRRSPRRCAVRRGDGRRRHRRTRDRHDAAAHRHAARRCPASSPTWRTRSARRFADQGFVPMGGAAGTARRRHAVRRPAQAGRRDRRHVRHRRSRARRHRHRDAHRRRSRLRVRSSDVQPRPDRIPDDAGLRLHGPAEPLLVGQAVDHERSDRHVHCRIAPRRLPAGSAPGRACCRSR